MKKESHINYKILFLILNLIKSINEKLNETRNRIEKKKKWKDKRSNNSKTVIISKIFRNLISNNRVDILRRKRRKQYQNEKVNVENTTFRHKSQVKFASNLGFKNISKIYQKLKNFILIFIKINIPSIQLSHIREKVSKLFIILNKVKIKIGIMFEIKMNTFFDILKKLKQILSFIYIERSKYFFKWNIGKINKLNNYLKLSKAIFLKNLNIVLIFRYLKYQKEYLD